MKYKHIKGGDVEKQDFGSVVVQEILEDEKYEKLAIAVVEIKGNGKFGLNQECDMIDFILEGKGNFYIEDDEFDVQKGDLVFIPKQTKFKHEGKMTLLAISTPRFDRDKVVRFDN